MKSTILAATNRKIKLDTTGVELWEAAHSFTLLSLSPSIKLSGLTKLLCVQGFCKIRLASFSRWFVNFFNSFSIPSKVRHPQGRRLPLMSQSEQSLLVMNGISHTSLTVLLRICKWSTFTCKFICKSSVSSRFHLRNNLNRLKNNGWSKKFRKNRKW